MIFNLSLSEPDYSGWITIMYCCFNLAELWTNTL